MQIFFASHKLRKLCESERDLVRKFGPRHGRLIAVRLSELRAVPTLAAAKAVPHLSLHQLGGDRDEQFALTLAQPYRLIVRVASDPIPRLVDGGIDLAEVKAGLPLIRFHDLRHTAATLLLTAGVHPKVVSEMLGHSSVAITLDRYSHVIPTMQEEAALQMDRLLSDPVRVQTRVRRIPRTRKSPDSSVNRGSEMKVGTAYRTPGEPSHASQPRSPSTPKRHMRRKKQDG